MPKICLLIFLILPLKLSALETLELVTSYDANNAPVEGAIAITSQLTDEALSTQISHIMQSPQNLLNISVINAIFFLNFLPAKALSTKRF